MKTDQKKPVRTCVIFNPTARGDKARRFRRHLDQIGRECTLLQTAAGGDATRLATEAARDGFEIIVACGGDGTVNEVLNGIAQAPDGLQTARLGVLPLGTVNVFARELGISADLESAWQVIRNAHESAIDLPAVEFTRDGATHQRHFAQLAGAGLDARAIELVRWPLKKSIGPLAYVVAGLSALFGSQAQITATGDGHSASGELILIGNGRLYGGDYRVFPKADLRDGLLEVCVFPKASWWTLARCGPELLLHGSLPSGATKNFQTGTLTLTSTPAAPFEVDGELVGHLPATITLRRSGLRVIVP